LFKGFRNELVPEIKLAQVTVKVLLSDEVINAIDAALEIGEIPFHGISGDAKSVFIADVFFYCTVHAIMVAHGVEQAFMPAGQMFFLCAARSPAARVHAAQLAVLCVPAAL
jgi:hypothetical protein